MKKQLLIKAIFAYSSRILWSFSSLELINLIYFGSIKNLFEKINLGVCHSLVNQKDYPTDFRICKTDRLFIVYTITFTSFY